MRKTWLTTLAFAPILFSFLSCSSKPKDSSSIPGIATGAPVRVEGATVVRRTLAQTREALAASYRLAPDRRLLDSIAYLDFRITGRSPAQVSARFADGKWQLAYGNRDVGTLSELPEFEEGERLLGVWAERLLKEHPMDRASGETVGTESGLLFEDLAIEALTKAEPGWADAERRAEAVHLGSSAVASLAFQMVDSMQTADALFGRALGLVALDRALGGKVTAARALVAEALGYGAAATKIAAELPAADPLRAYLEHDDGTLRKLASDPRSTTASRYLWHRRLLINREVAQAGQFRKQRFGSMELRQPLVLSRLRWADFATTRVLAPAAPSLVLLETIRRGHGPRVAQAEVAAKSFYGHETDPDEVKGIIYERLGIDPAKAMAAFDEELTGLGEGKGALGVGGILQDYERASMYTALESLGSMHLEMVASNESSRQFATELGAEPSPTATRFKRWYDYQVESRVGTNVLGELLDNIQKLDTFGGQPLVDVYEHLRDRLDWGSPVTITAARRVIARLDTRPAHRIFVGDLAWDGLLDLKLAEAMYRSGTKAAPGVFGVQSWLARFTGDPELIASTLALKDLPAHDRIELLKSAEKNGAASPASTAAEVLRIAASDERWSTLKAAVDYFKDKSDHEQAARLAREWLRKYPNAPGLEPTLARVFLSRSLRAIGRNAEALAAIKPAIASYQGNAMYEAATLLTITGQTAAGEELMRAMLKRYPSAKSVAGLVEVLWRRGESAAAAGALVASPVTLRGVDWNEDIAPSFVEVFVHAKAPGAVEAFEELKKAHIIPENLMQVVGAVGVSDPRLAFDLLTHVDAANARPAVAVTGYRLLRKLEGAARASEWATPRLRAVRTLSAAALCLTGNEEEPLWLLPEPPAGPERDILWLFRAVASQLHRDSSHREELRQHYQAKGTERYNVLGRVVMGLDDEKAATELAGDVHQVCEVGYYLGAAAQGRGKIEDSSDWYRAALETSLVGENEYVFSYDQLSSWKREGKSLARLAASLK